MGSVVVTARSVALAGAKRAITSTSEATRASPSLTSGLVLGVPFRVTVFDDYFNLLLEWNRYFLNIRMYACIVKSTEFCFRLSIVRR